MSEEEREEKVEVKYVLQYNQWLPLSKILRETNLTTFEAVAQINALKNIANAGRSEPNTGVVRIRAEKGYMEVFYGQPLIAS